MADVHKTVMGSGSPRRGKIFLVWTAKAAVTLGAITWLVTHVDIGAAAGRLVRVGPGDVVLVAAIILAQVTVTSFRWMLVSRAVGVPLGFPDSFRLYWIGMFFSQVMPTSIGGDAIRSYLLVRRGIPLGRAFSCIANDRIIALLSLMLLVVLTLPLAAVRLREPWATAGLALVGGGSLLGFAAVTVLWSWLSPWFYRYARTLTDILSDVFELFRNTRLIFSSVILSLALHGSAAILATFLARAAGLHNIGLLDCLIVVPLAIFASMLPASIGGWGVRETAMVIGFSALGIPSQDGLSVAILFGLSGLSAGLLGGVAWLFYQNKATTQPPSR